MYIERDAKILLIYYSVYGLICFVGLYIVFLFFQQRLPNENFTFIQIMIFGTISILTLILLGGIYSLKKEISSQREHLQNLQINTRTLATARVPYNKSGLYFIIIVSIIGILVFLYLLTVLVLQGSSNPNISFQKGVLETVSFSFF